MGHLGSGGRTVYQTKKKKKVLGSLCHTGSTGVMQAMQHHLHLYEDPSQAFKEVLVLLFLTSSCDPGIIPRNSHPPEGNEDQPL